MPSICLFNASIRLLLASICCSASFSSPLVESIFFNRDSILSICLSHAVTFFFASFESSLNTDSSPCIAFSSSASALCIFSRALSMEPSLSDSCLLASGCSVEPHTGHGSPAVRCSLRRISAWLAAATAFSSAWQRLTFSLAVITCWFKSSVLCLNSCSFSLNSCNDAVKIVSSNILLNCP